VGEFALTPNIHALECRDEFSDEAQLLSYRLMQILLADVASLVRSTNSECQKIRST